jgi:hypothetical protein
MTYIHVCIYNVTYIYIYIYIYIYMHITINYLFGKSVLPFFKKEKISRRKGSTVVSTRQLQFVFACPPYPAQLAYSHQLPRFPLFIFFAVQTGKRKEPGDARGQRLSVPDGYKLSASPALTCAVFLAGWQSLERRGLSPEAPAPRFFQNNEKNRNSKQ